jgi:hypothetical protein
MTDIIDTAELPEDEFSEDIAATTESEPAERLEFFVQMRGYTLREMDNLIVEAAARQIVGASRNTVLAKEIEQRCITMTAEKVDAKLASVTAEIVDQPMIPAFGSSKEPVTMRDFMALCGRQYLAEMVGNDGKPATGSGYGYSGNMPRMQYLVKQALDLKFKREIEAATNAAIREVQAAIKADHAALLAAENQRLREALAKVVS